MTLTLAQLFVSRDRFVRRFVDGLVRLLSTNAPEARHVVLAYNNAVAIDDPDLLGAAREAARLVLAHPPTGTDPDEAADRRILAEALSGPAPRIDVTRSPAGRLIVTNPLRRQRPPRAAAAVAAVTEMEPALWRPFDPAQFSFQHLPVEYMTDVAWRGLRVRLYYNKYPSGPWHLSVVPDPVAGHPQFLTSQFVELALELVAAARCGALPDAVGVYNSLLARASINHCHFQLLEIPGLDPAGNLAAADHPPAEMRSADVVWRAVQRLQRGHQPFNTVTTRSTFIVPRRAQGEIAEPGWTTGFAALELGGYVMVVRPDDHVVTDVEVAAVVRSLVV